MIDSDVIVNATPSENPYAEIHRLELESLDRKTALENAPPMATHSSSV